MTVIGLLLLVLGIVAVGSLAFWIIKKFFTPEWHTLALGVTGVLLLLALLFFFFGDVGNTRIWSR